ncbi:MAG: DUF6391 domain-containing protein [Elainellaceae cyanobacterium]
MAASTYAHLLVDSPSVEDSLLGQRESTQRSSSREFIPHHHQDSELLKQMEFLPGFREFLMMRQVHALEHATVWVLSELDAGLNAVRSRIDNGSLSGLSTESGFYLYGEVNTLRLRQAVNIALERLIRGEWSLAVHPRCGTNISVNFALTAGMALGMHLLMPRGFLEQLLGLGIAAGLAAQVTPEIGNLVQQHVTTAIPFNLKVEGIQARKVGIRPSEHFVSVQWFDS